MGVFSKLLPTCVSAFGLQAAVRTVMMNAILYPSNETCIACSDFCANAKWEVLWHRRIGWVHRNYVDIPVLSLSWNSQWTRLSILGPIFAIFIKTPASFDTITGTLEYQTRRLSRIPFVQIWGRSKIQGYQNEAWIIHVLLDYARWYFRHPRVVPSH
jgi:hypothetical protein